MNANRSGFLLLIIYSSVGDVEVKFKEWRESVEWMEEG